MKDLKKFEIKEEEKKNIKGGPSGYPTDFYGASSHILIDNSSDFGDGN